MVFTPDSKALFSGSADRSLKRWDCVAGKETPFPFATPPGRPQNAPSRLFIRPDGQKLAIYTQYDGNHTDVAGFSPIDGKYLFRHNDVYRPTYSMAFTAAGRFMVTCGRDCSIRVFDFDKNNGIPVYQHLWHIFEKESAGAVAITPNGSQIICANSKGAIRIGKAPDKQVLHTFQADDGPIPLCVISPDGKRLATAGQDHVVKIWDLATHTERRRWSLRGLTQLNFTADSNQLVTCHADGSLFMLDLP